ncbi:MAG TPA: hypothetical protein VLA24_01425 [Pseudomonadales bacterium]|nr:hypothetical protein [Pseudomonadales bacterium]
MAIYAISGVTLIFRKTDFLKYDQLVERQLPAALSAEQLNDKLQLKEFVIQNDTATRIEFKGGSYDRETGETSYTIKDYPLPLAKLVKLHKATEKSPLFYLNIFFGFSLLFFVITSFFMYIPKAPQFKTGMKVAGAGALFALAIVIFGGY